MARRKNQDEGREHPLEAVGSVMQNLKMPSASTRRWILWGLAATVVVGSSLYVLYQVEQFLTHSPTFAINGGAGDARKTLHITGTQHASVNAIEGVFAEDIGRSVYSVPLEERLTTLQTVDWVRGATVSRIWPNQLIVNVSERQPVAFVKRADSSVGLIDRDGIILPAVPDRFELPVLDGVDAEAPAEDLRDAVGEMMRIANELGEQMVDISEVDVSDRENLAISRSYDGRMLKLILGDRNFAARYENFLNHYDDIRERLPGARVLDLRLEDRITVVR